MAKAGLILAIIALGLAVLIAILAIIGVSILGAKMAEMQKGEQALLLLRSLLT